MMGMDLTEDMRRVLRAAQGDLPLCDSPFAVWAGQAGVDEEEMVAGVRALKDAGVIRRFGGVFDSRAMGMFTTLAGAKVPPERLDEALEKICAVEGTTHVYVRSHEINVWFTLAAESALSADAALESLRRALDVGIWSMPLKRKYKLEVSFET